METEQQPILDFTENQETHYIDTKIDFKDFDLDLGF